MEITLTLSFLCAVCHNIFAPRALPILIDAYFDKYTPPQSFCKSFSYDGLVHSQMPIIRVLGYVFRDQFSDIASRLVSAVRFERSSLQSQRRNVTKSFITMSIADLQEHHQLSVRTHSLNTFS